jgi:hypothetical protein
MIGAATINTLSPYERRELERVLAHLVRGSAILTKLLRRRRSTRPAVRAVPAIVHSTAKTLVRRSASGRPVTRRAAGRAMATHTRRVLGNPRVCSHAIHRNHRASRTIQRRAGIPTRRYRPGSPRGRRYPTRAYGTRRYPGRAYGVRRYPARAYGVRRYPRRTYGVRRYPAGRYGVRARPVARAYGGRRPVVRPVVVRRVPVSGVGVRRVHVPPVVVKRRIR